MASPMIADNVNDNICEDNTSIASGNCNNDDDKNDTDDDKNDTDESYKTTDSTTTRTTATVTTTTTDEVTWDVNINECDREILLKVSLDNIKISPSSLFLVRSR